MPHYPNERTFSPMYDLPKQPRPINLYYVRGVPHTLEFLQENRDNGATYFTWTLKPLQRSTE